MAIVKRSLNRLFGSLLKVAGFITIVCAIWITILTGGYLIVLGMMMLFIGVFLYLIDFIINLVNKKYYKISQISLFILYLLALGWYYMDWQSHTNITFQTNSRCSAIVFGIEGYPELPKTFFWTKNINLPLNNILITSTKASDMPRWVRYKYSNGAVLTYNTVDWNPNFTYKCIVNRKVIKAWVFTLNKSSDVSIQKKITDLSNQVNVGKVNTIYTNPDNLLVKGQDGSYITLQGEGLSFLPDAVANLNINTIYLAENKFTTIPPQLYKIKSLQHIILNVNPIIELPADLHRLKKLKSLSVGSTLIKEINVDLSKLESLEDFDISSNKLTKFPEQIKNIPHLKWLSLESNEFTDLSFIDGKLRKLETLQVYTNKLKDISHIKYLTNLKELLIFDNQIDSIPDEIAALSNLEKLEIWDNPIKYISPKIRKLTKLKELRIDDNQLSKTDKLHLAQWLPKCKIHFQTRD
ncbi:MAG: leucine-rich repeat domain-containing protein [Sphingobacteriaceae bacterium]|nr:MAG: leucine-rich repeat domain-containing protein [Sphingobacteriaceae bacterium]